ncbi:MAG: Hsp20/alpha crystallin family protein [Ruminococcaceae bacterium]|nr:Hsp20/alpha crystallin family protein [Oscillospiraceae bacterium]
MFDLTPFDFGSRAFAAYDPFKEMEEMERRFFGHRTPVFNTDIRETEQAYILEADLPGFSKEDIRAEIKNGYLTIIAEKKQESEERNDKTNYIRRERSYGSVRRTFDLSGIRAEEITAAYKDGVLTLTLPKEEIKKDEPRRLDIQ